jgi:predicted glutamine amidotransferase
MCGIVGVVAKPSNGLTLQLERAFFQMLYADALRGEDSTGIVGVENNTTFHIAKEASSAEWFSYQLKNTHKDIVNAMYNRGKLYIGHNRKKTSGTIKDETAHPFVVNDHFAMVHNGTLYNHKSLADTEVDSEALAIHLEKAFKAGGTDRKKIKEALEEAFGKVYGAYAVVCYDQDTNMVHFIRNKERPLSIIETDNAWYFMSEPLMGAWILTRNEYKYESLKATHLLEHEWVSIDLDTNKLSKELFTPKKSWTSYPNQGTGGNSGTAMLPQSSTGRNFSGEKTTTPNATAAKYCTSAKDLKKFRRDWLGKRVSFWVDDYLEKNFPKTISSGEVEIVLMGDVDEIDYKHTVYAAINMNELGFKYEEDFLSKKFTGVIEGVSEGPNGSLRIDILDGAKPIVASLKMSDIKERQEYKTMLRLKTLSELNTYFEENKHTMSSFQVTSLNQEIAFRNGIRGVEHAAQIARNNGGWVLKQEIRDDRFVYMNEAGEIYYESAVVVH